MRNLYPKQFLSFLVLFFSVLALFNIVKTGFTQEGRPSIIILQTNHGDIEIKLFPEKAPKTCENFTGLVEKGYFDGLIFHRVIKNFMIQTGDPTGTGMGGNSLWGGSFEDEVTPELQFNRPGLVAMANAGPNTNRSQFFITVVPTPWLNMKHTIFGEVLTGFEHIQEIANTPTHKADKPIEDQQILRAYVKP